MVSKALAWFLPVGIAASSLILWQDLLDPEQSVRFLYLTILGAVIWVVLWRKDKAGLSQSFRETVHWKNPVFACIIVWLAATIFSLPYAIQKSEGYVETARIAFFLFSYVWVSAAFSIADQSKLHLSIGFCVTGFILSAIGLKDFLQVFSQITADNAYYQMGNMGNRNLLAIMVSLCLPFHFIAFEAYKSQFVRTILTLNVLLIVAVVMLTNSRVGWLGISIQFIACTVIFLIMGLTARLRKETVLKISLGFSAFVVAVIISFSALLLKNPGASTVTKQRLKSFSEFRSEKNIHTESIKERLQIWKNSFQLIRENPLTGVGAGNWKFRYAEKGLPERAQRGNVVFLQPHNDFLWVFSETGIIGGIAFTALFLFGILFSLRKTLNADGFNPGSVAAMAAFTGIASYTVHSFFDFPKERPLISFAFACMLALAGVNRSKYIAFFSIKMTRFIIISILILSSLISAFWAIRMKGELNLKKAIAARQGGNYKSMKNYLNEINPKFFESDLSGTPIAWYLSEIAYFQKDINAFKKYSERSITLNPFQLYNLYNLGSIYYKEGDVKTAIHYWERAVKIAPRFTDAAVNLSAAYYNQKKYERAAELLALPLINYQNESHGTIAAAVLGKYINLMSDTVSAAVIKEELLNLSVNAERVRNLQGNMAAKNQSLRDAAILEAIRAAEMGQNLNSEEASLLRIRYGLNDQKN